MTEYPETKPAGRSPFRPGVSAAEIRQTLYVDTARVTQSLREVNETLQNISGGVALEQAERAFNDLRESLARLDNELLRAFMLPHAHLYQGLWQGLSFQSTPTLRDMPDFRDRTPPPNLNCCATCGYFLRGAHRSDARSVCMAGAELSSSPFERNECGQWAKKR